MTAAVPTILTEVAAWLGAIGIIVTTATLIFTRKPFKWLWKTLVSVPFGSWVRSQINDSETGKLVKYHLGPNGTTPPVHRRIAMLELRALVDSFEDEDEGDDDA